jgi:hypothetical protein
MLHGHECAEQAQAGHAQARVPAIFGFASSSPGATFRFRRSRKGIDGMRLVAAIQALTSIPHNDCAVDSVGVDGNPACRMWGW